MPFDAIAHEWLGKFVERRIADPRVHRHIQKRLNAGVLEDGCRYEVETGTPQGGSISPLLANIDLHYVFDLWVDPWRRPEAHGEVIVVRYQELRRRMHQPIKDVGRWLPRPRILHPYPWERLRVTTRGRSPVR